MDGLVNLKQHFPAEKEQNDLRIADLGNRLRLEKRSDIAQVQRDIRLGGKIHKKGLQDQD